MITKIIDWVLWSSKNADKISLTVKSILSGAIVVTLLQVLKIDVPVDMFSATIDMFVTIIQEVGVVATAVVTIVGLVRKIVSTFKGTNDVLNTHYLQ